MGDSRVLEAVIWGAVILAVVVFGLRGLQSIVGDLLAQRKAEHDLRAQKVDLDRRKLEKEAELDGHTVEERVELRKAELLQRAAEARGAAEVAIKTVPYQVESRRQVIDAETEGLALAAKERAIAGASGDMTLLIRGYQAYMNILASQGRAGDILSFRDWAGEEAE